MTVRDALRPLALGTSGEDPTDELKGYGLLATWPTNLSAKEMFTTLVPIKEHNIIGGPYNRFLDGIASQLRPTDIVVALNWARQHAKGHDQTDKLHKVATDILEKAVEHLAGCGNKQIP